ncbi:MAG: cell envelope integrity protein TolA [Ferruginibacter sp.]
MKSISRLITSLFLLLPAIVFAQQKDITGLWKGTLYNDTTQKYYRYEVGISKEKKGYSGFSHTWFVIGDTQYFGVKKVKVELAKDGKILIEDNGLIAHNYPVPPNKGVRQLNVLVLDDSGETMVLSGPFSTNRTKEYHSLTGSIRLERKNDFWQSSLVPHLQELGYENELSFVKEEKNAVAKVEAESRAATLAAEKQQKDEIARNEKAAKDKLLEEEKNTRKQEKEQAAAEKALTKETLKKEAAAVKEQEKQQASQQRRAEQEAKEKEKAEKALAKQDAEKKKTAEKEMAKRVIPSPAPALPVAANTAPAADIAKRTTVVQQTVTFVSDSLQLSLYDNGEVDGDTVSVLMNGSLIFSKQGLGTTAAKKTIYIPAGINQVELVMYAETLGTIPPNTGLLVVKDGPQLFELRFSGDFKKNASIIFKRKE